MTANVSVRRDQVFRIFPPSSWCVVEAELMSLGPLPLALLPVRVVHTLSCRIKDQSPTKQTLKVNFIQIPIAYYISKDGTHISIYHHFLDSDNES